MMFLGPGRGRVAEVLKADLREAAEQGGQDQPTQQAASLAVQRADRARDSSGTKGRQAGRQVDRQADRQTDRYKLLTLLALWDVLKIKCWVTSPRLSNKM